MQRIEPLPTVGRRVGKGQQLAQLPAVPMFRPVERHARDKHDDKDQYAITDDITAHGWGKPKILVAVENETEEVELISR